VGRRVCRSAGLYGSTGRSVGRSVGWPVGRPVGRSPGWSTGRPVGQSAGLSVARSAGRSAGHTLMSIRHRLSSSWFQSKYEFDGTPIHALSELVDVTLFLLKMDSASTTTRAATLSFHDDSTNNRFKQMHFNTVSRSIKSLRVSLGAAPRKNWATPPHPTPARHTLCHICCPRSAVFFLQRHRTRPRCPRLTTLAKAESLTMAGDLRKSTFASSNTRKRNAAIYFT